MSEHKVQKWREIFHLQIKAYQVNVYNYNETGLFYHLLKKEELNITEVKIQKSIGLLNSITE